MKITISIVVNAASIASAADLGPALRLGLLSNHTFSSQSSVPTATPSLLEKPSSNLSLSSTNLPDRRFSVNFAVRAPLLPINSALMNILHFMTLVAAQDFTQETQPRAYSTPEYRDIDISTQAWTQPRFLLWGIYLSAIEMVKFARFNDATLELYWEAKIVGKVKIAVKPASSSVVAGGNSTRDLGNTLAQTNLTGNGQDAPEPRVVVGDGTDGNLAPPALSSINDTTAISATPNFAVTFENVSGARTLNRNELFLTFYTAILHVAQYPSESHMQSFAVASPGEKLYLHMQKLGLETQYRKVLAALLYVPKYMMEHANFGYRETEFIVRLNGKPAYLGTLIKVTPSVERRVLKG